MKNFCKGVLQAVGALTGLLQAMSAVGQDLLFIQNTDGFYVQSGALLSVQGGVRLGGSPAGDAWMLLDGIAELGSGLPPAWGLADWTVLNAAHPGTEGSGELHLLGGLQSLGGSVELSLPTLRLVAPGQVYRLDSGLRIRDSLVLGAGAGLLLEGQELVMENPDPRALQAAGGAWLRAETHPDSGWDYSALRWETGPVDTAWWYHLPFGREGPDAVLEVQGSGAEESYFRVSTYGTGEDNRPLPVAGRGLDGPVGDLYSLVSGGDNAPWTVDRFWVLDPGPGGRSARLGYASGENSAEVRDAESCLRAQVWQDGEGWLYPGMEVDAGPDDRSVLAWIDRAGAWTLALESSPLPVECLGLSAQREVHSGALLEWTTASERHNLGFVVERLDAEPARASMGWVPGAGWVEVGWVPGAGWSSGSRQYRFSDREAGPGALLYRLRQRDAHGREREACGMASLAAGGGSHALRIWPNPTRERLYGSGAGGRMLLRDVQGRVRWTGWAEGEGVWTAALSPDLPPGLYHVELEGSARSAWVVLQP